MSVAFTIGCVAGLLYRSHLAGQQTADEAKSRPLGHPMVFAIAGGILFILVAETIKAALADPGL